MRTIVFLITPKLSHEIVSVYFNRIIDIPMKLIVLYLQKNNALDNNIIKSYTPLFNEIIDIKANYSNKQFWRADK